MPVIVVVIAARPMATDVALVVPRFRAVPASMVSAADEVIVRLPPVTLQTEARAAVIVRPLVLVKDEAPVAVRVTEPGP